MASSKSDGGVERRCREHPHMRVLNSIELVEDHSAVLTN